MLVLSRKENQRIVIGDDIKIVVVSVKGDKVRLGIDAPENIPVHRQEVYDVIAREGQRKSSAKAARDGAA
ncbi:MAG: carbon storage regulator CsrA [Pirellulales bacterium]